MPRISPRAGKDRAIEVIPRDNLVYKQTETKPDSVSADAGGVAAGFTPVRNWQQTGEQSFPNLEKIADADAIIAYQSRKYGCANCPIACGGPTSFSSPLTSR